MKVAIIGAGFAGLATAWHLLQKAIDVTLFDKGSGASSVSTGLLHPYPGREAQFGWRAKEGMEASLQLLQIASKETPVYEANGLLRFAITEAQRALFPPQNLIPQTAPIPALWVPEGLTVYSRLYLEGLRSACSKARFIQQQVSTEELHEYDAIVMATGAETPHFPECKHLALQRTIGQALICRWPEKLPVSLLALGHIAPTEDPELCHVGSTYEHTKEPDPKKALELLDKAALFYPPAKEYKIEEIRSGIRIAPKIGYRPIVEKVGPKTWVFTGLGSRGLLYHALFAKELANEIGILDESMQLPEKVERK